MAENTQFGVLLPHFGNDTSRAQLDAIARCAEDLGFDSLWTRDHLYIPPENKEHGGIIENEFLEAFQTLAHVNAITDDITLGTSVANAHRHPVKLSQEFGTLDRLSDGQVICGVGAGTFRGEFDAMDLPFEKQGTMADELLEILRQAFTEAPVSYEGEVFAFEDVTINPRPGNRVPIWYGGLSTIAVKRAFRYADGWFPGRMPLDVLDERVELLEHLESEYGRTLQRSYVVNYSVAPSSEAARTSLEVHRLLEDVNELLDAEYSSPADITGSFVAGEPAECTEQLKQLVDRGMDHIVLDARHDFESLREMLELTAEDVIPALR